MQVPFRGNKVRDYRLGLYYHLALHAGIESFFQRRALPLRSPGDGELPLDMFLPQAFRPTQPRGSVTCPIWILFPLAATPHCKRIGKR